MASLFFAKKGEALTFDFGLWDKADSLVLKDTPTLAAGDVKVSKDGAAEANIATLPTSSGRRWPVALSGTEMNADRVSLVFHDASGDEWCDCIVNILTTPFDADELEALLTAYTATRAGYLDKLDVSGNLAHSDAADSYKATVSALALEDTLTAMKGAGWTNETLKAIIEAIEALTIPTTGEIADGVWDEDVVAAHNGAGTAGALIDDLGTPADFKATGFSTHDAAAVWGAVTREITGGALTTPADYKADVSNLDAAVSSRLATSGYTAPANDSIATILADLIDGGRLDSLIDLIKAATDRIPASPAAVGSAMTLATSEDVYHAQIWSFVDALNSYDRYAVVWFKNGEWITSGVTSPTIQVYAVATGADLIAETAMTADGNGGFRYSTATQRTAGATYMAKVTATIDGETRSFPQPVGRDSEAA